MGPNLFPEVSAETGWDHGVDVIAEYPLADLHKPSADVFGEGAVNGDAHHAVGRVSKPLEPRLGVAQPLEACREAGLHVNADNLPCVVLHRLPEAAVAVLQAGLLDILQEAGCCWLPAVSLFGRDALRVVLPEGSVSQGWVAQGIAGLLQSLVHLSRPKGASVLGHKLVNRELLVSCPTQEPDGFRLVLGGLLDGFPDIAFKEVDLSAWVEVEVFGPGVAIVADEVDG